MLSAILAVLLSAPVSGDATAANQLVWRRDGEPVEVVSARASLEARRLRIEAGAFQSGARETGGLVRVGWSGERGGFMFGMIRFPFEVENYALTFVEGGDTHWWTTEMVTVPSFSMRVGRRDGVHVRTGVMELGDATLSLARAGLAIGDGRLGSVVAGWTLDAKTGSGPYVELEAFGGERFLARTTITAGTAAVFEHRGAAVSLAAGVRW